VNHAALALLTPAQVIVDIQQADEAEMDEMWSFVGRNGCQRWLWHAIDHHSGAMLAYVLGTHTDQVCLELQRLLAPFGITRFYTDNWGTYQRHLTPEQHVIGKKYTQKIERKHLTLRLNFAVARHMTMRNIINSNTYRYSLALYRYMKRYLTN
jgi:insertion element IS1 protein InsB